MELEIKKELLNMFSTILKEEDIIINDKIVLNGKELDIYIPKLNIAIEYNGLMFHSFGKHKSSIFNNFEKEELKKHNHLLKTNLCEEKRIHLFHINENEWINSKKKLIWLDIFKQNIEYKINKIEPTATNYEHNTIYIKELDYNNIQENKENIITFLENNSLEYYSNIFEEFLIEHTQKNIKFLGIYNTTHQKEELIGISYGYLKKNHIKDNNTTIFHIEDICFNNSFQLTNLNVLFENISKYLISNNKQLYNITYNLNRRWFNLANCSNKIISNINYLDISILEPNIFYFFNTNIQTIYNKEPKLTINENKLDTNQNNNVRKYYDCGNIQLNYKHNNN
jgi:hypothetical protein